MCSAPLLYRRLSVRIVCLMKVRIGRNERFCACWEIVRAIAIAKYSCRIQEVDREASLALVSSSDGWDTSPVGCARNADWLGRARWPLCSTGARKPVSLVHRVGPARGSLCLRVAHVAVHTSLTPSSSSKRLGQSDYASVPK